ncbi:MAG: 16S rRNA (adenine(1518)-N(6)/adenine(1519)-N(6))-dimethyltransferase RsmA [Muribaculum sp.]|nr:16S rRNA (adenine(1518)-N(6)/adenine(1519)-N(6))-dimethyltransferase RsmA [Muribaculaceae bacterium]MCM1081011.1 16S rRNA (adenine(1518)-N(6)/adenine(1519)-N(6))-dimethyltransferase RsmA [Muribaculum sp.]
MNGSTNKVKPKKALGQHFLTDENIARRIAETLNAYKGVPVLEVGPGMGVLTKYLLELGHNVTVVEIDNESVDYLNSNFPQLHERIIGQDFLTLNLEEAMGERPFCVIGNYPYNISSQIFFKVLDYKDLIPCCSGMLQKEVAERIAAKPGSKTYGILSVLLQAWYDIEYLFTVDENVFNPPPKVKSGVIRLTRNDVTDLGCDVKLMRTIVKTTFGQRRKTLRNSIKGLLPAGCTLPDNPIWQQRPEQLSVQQFIDLTNIVTKLRQQG